MMKIKKSYSQRLIESRVGVPQRRGPLRIVHRCFLLVAYYPYLFLSWLYRNLSILSQEICSLFGRIAVQRKGLNYFPVTRSYSSCSPSQRPFLNSYNRARSACISEMASNHPWSTRVDLQLFLEGWDKGEMWATQIYSRDSCTAQSVASIQDQS